MMENNLPLGWTLTTLGQIADWGSGGTPSRKETKFYNGTIPWLKTGELNDGVVTEAEEYITDLGLRNSSAKLFPKGSVAIAMYGATIGKVAILGIDATTNQACAVAVVNKALTTNKFLFYFLKSQKQEFINKGKGGAQPNISQMLIKEHPIPLPPFAEQQRIVARLDALMEKVESARERLEKIPAILKRFRQAVLSAAVSGRLTADWRERKGDVTIRTLGTLVKDLKYGTSQKCDVVPAVHTVLRIPNISEGRIDVTDLKYTELPSEEYKKLKLEKGDILLIRSNGSVDLVGKAAIINENEVGYAYAGYLIRLRVDKDKALPEYLNKALASSFIRRQIEAVAKSTSGVNNINSEEVRSLQVPTPVIEEQYEIVERVEELFQLASSLEARYQTAKSYLDQLPQSILAKAFRGELVPQDPNDEPASVLLERIQVEKTGTSKKKSKSSSMQLTLDTL